jgi:hypothetical protein
LNENASTASARRCSSSVRLSRVEAGQISLDLAVQGVEQVILAASAGGGLAISLAQSVGNRFDHRIEHVDHA